MDCNVGLDKKAFGEVEGANISLDWFQERMGDEKLDAMTTGIS